MEGVFVSKKIRSSQKREKMCVVPLTKHLFGGNARNFLNS